MTYYKLGLVLTTSAILLTGCVSDATQYTAAEEEARQELSQSNYQPAARELRDNIGTQEILAQAAFWSHEYNLNPSDLESAIKFAAIVRKLGNPQRAVEITRITRALYPKDPYLNAEYAAGLLATQKSKPALKILNSTLKDAPSYGRLWSLKGVALDQMEQYAQARPFYERALKITPNDPNVMANLGLNYALSGDPHTAKTWLTRAAADPDASDSVFANLELVEGLVAEAGPISNGPARLSAESAPRPIYNPPAQPQAQQYGTQSQYAAPQTQTRARTYSGPQTPNLQAPNFQASGLQGSGLQASGLQTQKRQPAYRAPFKAAPNTAFAPTSAPNYGSRPVPTSQDVLARISKNLTPKAALKPVRRQPFSPAQGYGPSRSPFAAPGRPQQGQQRPAYQNQPRQYQGRQNQSQNAPQGNAGARGQQGYAGPTQRQAPQGYAQQGYAPPRQASQQPFRQQQAQQPQQAQQQGQVQQNQYQQGQAQQNQYQRGQAQQNPYQQGQTPQSQYQPQGQSGPAGAYNQRRPQLRGGYPAPQAPYYGGPATQQQPAQRRPAARRRG